MRIASPAVNHRSIAASIVLFWFDIWCFVIDCCICLCMICTSVLWYCWCGIRRASALKKVLSDELLAWSSVWSEVQIICIWSIWCHCHPVISCFIEVENGLPFWCRLTQMSWNRGSWTNVVGYTSYSQWKPWYWCWRADMKGEMLLCQVSDGWCSKYEASSLVGVSVFFNFLQCSDGVGWVIGTTSGP